MIKKLLTALLITTSLINPSFACTEEEWNKDFAALMTHIDNSYVLAQFHDPRIRDYLIAEVEGFNNNFVHPNGRKVKCFTGAMKIPQFVDDLIEQIKQEQALEAAAQND